MTKEILKQYRFCKKRIYEIDVQIEKIKRENTVRDTVQGSQKDYPYIMRSSKVYGCPDFDNDNSELNALYAERTKCKKIVRDVSTYVHSVEDNILRRALTAKYMEGDSPPKWDKVALKIGGGNTADSLRMAVSRFIQKN